MYLNSSRQSHKGKDIKLLLRWKVIRIPISHGIKQNEIVGRVLLGSQVVSLSAITFFTIQTFVNFGEYSYVIFS